MYKNIDERFWEAAKVQGKTYGVPSEKEIGSMPMWVFTKEYVDKYDIPVDEIHSLEDLEPWLKLIKEKEPDVVPMYLTSSYSAPIYMDLIQNPVGIEYGDETLTVKNVFETEKMKSTLKTMRKYYQAGYINKDAATASDDKSIKRFVTKGDGQPYAELVWGEGPWVRSGCDADHGYLCDQYFRPRCADGHQCADGTSQEGCGVIKPYQHGRVSQESSELRYRGRTLG